MQQMHGQLAHSQGLIADLTRQLADKGRDQDARDQGQALRVLETQIRTQLEDYKAETARMQAIGSIDPQALKPVVRELVSQALQTPIVPVMADHAAAEQDMQPEEPA